jgi:hypothetical protein
MRKEWQPWLVNRKPVAGEKQAVQEDNNVMVSMRREGASPSSAHGYHRDWAWGATQARLFTRVAGEGGGLECYGR